MRAKDSPLVGVFSEMRERQMVAGLCLLAALHVFIFSAAFPFFNNVDEPAHFDLVVKYSHGELPRHLAYLSAESLQYIAVFSSQEFLATEPDFPGGRVPPPIWLLPPDRAAPALRFREAGWNNLNHEASQPPLYYTLAGLWWRLENRCGLSGGSALYGLRFLNLFFVAGLVWLGWRAARLVFPEQKLVRLGVPALLAVIPQTAFYGLQNDVLSPLAFGAAFILLIMFSKAEIPSGKLGALAGLALAATFLTKLSNLPLLAVSALFVLFLTRRWIKTGKFSAALPALAALATCALLPMLAWLMWCRSSFGDFTGTTAKIQFLGWTHQPFSEWFQHPIFTLSGLWYFLKGNLATLWQGEILWHHQPLASPAVDLVYVGLTLALLLAGVCAPAAPSGKISRPPRLPVWFSLACLAAAFAFFAGLSIVYDFHSCFYPSRSQPFFVSGRLLLGALLPLLLLFVAGLDLALKSLGSAAKFTVLAGLVSFMLVSEIAIDWPVFFSAYNWFHM